MLAGPVRISHIQTPFRLAPSNAPPYRPGVRKQTERQRQMDMHSEHVQKCVEGAQDLNYLHM